MAKPIHLPTTFLHPTHHPSPDPQAVRRRRTSKIKARSPTVQVIDYYLPTRTTDNKTSGSSSPSSVHDMNEAIVKCPSRKGSDVSHRQVPCTRPIHDAYFYSHSQTAASTARILLPRIHDARPSSSVIRFFWQCEGEGDGLHQSAQPPVRMTKLG